jgi:hypothetical protein
MRFKVWRELILLPSDGERLEICFLALLIIACLSAGYQTFCGLELNRNYEKICFNVHHNSDRRSVCCFLHTTGNYCNFDQRSGNCQGFAHSLSGKEEEERS